MKKVTLILLLLSPLLLFAGGNPGNPLREFTVEDSVRWTLSYIEYAYNSGLTEEVISHFSTLYSDINGVNFTTITNIVDQLLGAEVDMTGTERFLVYNASSQVNGNQAIATASILIRHPGPNEDANLLIARDTITLSRDGDRWLVTSAPNLVANLGEAAGLEITPPGSFEPNLNEYEKHDREAVDSQIEILGENNE